MDCTPETPMVYQFDQRGKVYGPRPLEHVVTYYGATPGVAAAPADEAGLDAAWHPTREWAAIYATLPLTTDQAKRLTALGVSFDPTQTTTAAATARIQSAEQMARAAKDAKPPTASAVKRARALGVEPPPGVTRGALNRLMKQAELEQETAEMAAELAETGVGIPTGTSGADIQELFYALDDLEQGLAYAKRHGVKLTLPRGLSATEAAQYTAALPDLVSVVEDMASDLREMRECGQLSRIPKKSVLSNAYPWLWDMLRTGRWGTAGCGWLEFVERAERRGG